MAVVARWSDDEGWGVLESEQLPGGCWVHFSAIEADGWRGLTPRAAVAVWWSRVQQDGYAFRADRVLPTTGSGHGPPIRDADMVAALQALRTSDVEVTAVDQFHPGTAVLRFRGTASRREWEVELPLPSSHRLKPWLYCTPDSAEDAAAMLGIFLDEEVVTTAVQNARQDDSGRLILASYGFEQSDPLEHQRRQRIADDGGHHGKQTEAGSLTFTRRARRTSRDIADDREPEHTIQPRTGPQADAPWTVVHEDANSSYAPADLRGLSARRKLRLCPSTWWFYSQPHLVTVASAALVSRRESARSEDTPLMPSTLLSSGTLLVDDHLRDEAAGLAKQVHDRATVGLRVTFDDGASIDLPADLAAFISNVLNGVARGPISVQGLPEEITTTTAAEMLAVSRPTLMKWVRSGDLASRKVGSHTRLRTQDVLNFRPKLRSQREAAFEALRAWDEQLDAKVGATQ